MYVTCSRVGSTMRTLIVSDVLCDFLVLQARTVVHTLLAHGPKIIKHSYTALHIKIIPVHTHMHDTNQ